MTNKDLDKIGKMLSDIGKSKLKEFDIVFLIDATSSMGPYIEAAKCTAEDISKILLQKFPETNFQYGYVFYRDPIDSILDVHEIINLTDNVNSLPEQIGKIKAEGGGDLPEDWAGAYKKVNEEIKWRNGTKVIFHLADAGAHGKLFTPYDKYFDEEQKLINELNICCEKKVKIFCFVIEEFSRNSFEKCKEIYIKKGGFYEIYNFDKPKFSSKDKPLFLEVKNNIFRKKEDNINNHTSFFGNNNVSSDLLENKKENNNKDKSIFNNIFSLFSTKNGSSELMNLFRFDNNNDNKNSLFGNDKINNNTNSLFGNDKINDNTNSLFGNDKINNNNTNSLFGNDKINNNTNSIFGSIIDDNKTNIFENNEKINSNTKSLFANNKDSNKLFDNKTEGNLFGNIKENNNNNNDHSLFENAKENNNNSNSLFGNIKENNNNNNYQGLFENLKENHDNTKSKEITNYEEMNFQSRLNSSFFNLVVNSIQNINKSQINLFNNINNSNK